MLPSVFDRSQSESESKAQGRRTKVKAGTAHKHQSIAGAHTVFAVTSGLAVIEAETPQSYQEAMSSVDSDKWHAAMKSEIDGCVSQNTWVVVERSSLPPNANVIPVKWVFKVKTDETGAVTKYKARITPKGFKQKHGVDYFEVFANTGKYKTLRLLLAIAARQDLELRQMDVPQAFTQAPLDENVYMEMPEGFSQGPPGTMVCHLKKSLYGLKQSPRNWYKLVSSFIKDEMMFTDTASDPCLFWKKSRTGQMILLFLFVDDMQVAFDKRDEDEWSEAHRQLIVRFNITDLGESKYMLGMKITRDRSSRTIKLDQELYITKSLEKFGLDQCKIAKTPAVQSSSKPLDEREGDNIGHNRPTDVTLYQEKVGTLLYAAISTRIDIAFAVNKLTQHMLAPTEAHARAADRVFRYLAGSKSSGLVFGRKINGNGNGSGNGGDGNESDSIPPVTAYADADWGSDPLDRKSITGWIAMYHGDPISWASKKQKVVSQSSCEAELYAEAAAMNELSWLNGLLKEIHQVGKNDPVPLLYGDNQSTQELTKNGIKSERTKHIDIKYHFVVNEVNEGRVQLKWIPTTQQLADVLTKSLGRHQHCELTRQLMVAESGIDQDVKKKDK